MSNVGSIKMKSFKIVLITLHVIVAWVAILLCGWSWFWSSFGDWEYEEWKRIESPDSKHEAIVIRGVGILAERYAVCIVNKGEPYDTQRVNLDTSDIPQMKWESPSNLVASIDASDTRVFYYRPVWPSDPQEETLVELELDTF
jgi:hypothetical protein